jgi:hypothetical protein
MNSREILFEPLPIDQPCGVPAWTPVGRTTAKPGRACSGSGRTFRYGFG